MSSVIPIKLKHISNLIEEHQCKKTHIHASWRPRDRLARLHDYMLLSSITLIASLRMRADWNCTSSSCHRTRIICLSRFLSSNSLRHMKASPAHFALGRLSWWQEFHSPLIWSTADLARQHRRERSSPLPIGNADACSKTSVSDQQGGPQTVAKMK